MIQNINLEIHGAFEDGPDFFGEDYSYLNCIAILHEYKVFIAFCVKVDTRKPLSVLSFVSLYPTVEAIRHDKLVFRLFNKVDVPNDYYILDMRLLFKYFNLHQANIEEILSNQIAEDRIIFHEVR